MLQASYVLEKVRGVTVSDACLTQVCKPQSNANASYGLLPTWSFISFPEGTIASLQFHLKTENKI